MKKFIFFMVALVSAVTLQAKTIYLNAGDVWNNNSAVFFVHSWDDPANATDAQMTSVSGNIFQAEINDAHNNVIFLRLAPGKTEVVWETDNDCWGRTGDLTIADGNNMFAITGYTATPKFSEGIWSVYSSTPTIYAKNNWNNGDWAWKQMEYNTESDRYVLNNVVFGGTGININRAEDDNNALFFSADLNEARNLGIQVDQFDTINVTFNLNDSTIAVVIAGKYVAPAAPETKYYLVGDMTDWETEKIEIVEGTLTINLTEVKTYGMKILAITGEDKKWYSADSEMTKDNCTDWQLYDNVDANIRLKIETAGNYTFNWNADEKKLSVVYPFIAPAIYAKNNWNNGDWAWKQMEYNTESDRYVLNNVVFGGTGININRAEDDNNALFFSADLNEARNLGIAVDQFDTINVTFNLNDSTIAVVIAGKYVAPAAPEAKYYITGTVIEGSTDEDWKRVEMIAGNGDTFTVNITLEADSTYMFKVVKVEGEETTWYGVKDSEEQPWKPMQSDDCTGWWLIAGGDGKNIGLQTTTAGDYTFIFEKNANNVISVVYPGAVTALDEVNDTRMNRKMLMNGVLYIIRDGKMYNVQGIQVR